jgi:hypothetical protein
MRETAGTLWAGIDEAGYGPNIGPLVMTCVTALGREPSRPNLWRALEGRIDRACGAEDRLWVDDSKRILAAAQGYEKLEATALAAIAAAAGRGIAADDVGGLFHATGAGDLVEVELTAWCEGGEGADGVSNGRRKRWGARSLTGRDVNVVGVRSVVVGPARFNAWLEELGNKAEVHFRAFRRLIEPLFGETESRPVALLGDKHGGRNYYYGLLVDTFPDAWIDRGDEGAERSSYLVRSGSRRLSIDLEPKADGRDGLVALASIVSKYLRERWMQVFNQYCQRRMPGLRPTAGYPSDSARFRREIELQGLTAGWRLEDWWRLR